MSFFNRMKFLLGRTIKNEATIPTEMSEKYFAIIDGLKDVENIEFLRHGTSKVTNKLITNAEKEIGYSLPNSYKWFLLNYGEGEIGLDYEICTLHHKNTEFRQNDLVDRYIENSIKHSYFPKHILSICRRDGLDFVFDLEDMKNHECPVYEYEARTYNRYADSFMEFVERRGKEVAI